MPMSPLQEALIEEALVEVAEQAESLQMLVNDIYFKTSCPFLDIGVRFLEMASLLYMPRFRGVILYSQNLHYSVCSTATFNTYTAT